MPHDNLMRIGEVARMFDLSVGSLRHYEKLGLLEPAYVDEDSGYRYYGPRQLSALNNISYLRVLGMSLTDIKTFLDECGVEGMERQLAQQRVLVRERLRELTALERELDRRLTILRDAMASELEVVRVIEAPELHIATLEDSSKLTGAFDLELQIRRLQQGQDRALVFLGNLGVQVSRERLLRRDATGHDRVFLILDEHETYRGTVRTIPAGTCVNIRFRGGHPEAPAHYAKLFDYMDEHGLAPAGDSRELALIDDVFESDHTKHVAEITIPVRPA